MAQKRKERRYKKRLEVEFSASGVTLKGISADISERGMFIRTRYPFRPGTLTDVKIYLPDGQVARVRGIVRHAYKTDITILKNGMGIEFVERDMAFERFLQEQVLGYRPRPLRPITPRMGPQTGTGPEPQKPEPEDHADLPYIIIPCPSCGAKNRVREDKLDRGPKCGRCSAPLTGS